MSVELVEKQEERVNQFGWTEQQYRWQHCSQHSSWSSACPDCLRIHLLAGDDDDPDYLSKTYEFIVPQKVIQIANPNPKFQLIRQQLARVLAIFFAKEKKRAANAAVAKVGEIAKSYGKRFRKNQELTEEQKREVILAAYLAIQWTNLIDGVATDLFAAAQAGAGEGLLQILSSLSDSNLNIANQDAFDYAKKRSAEMIGKKYEGDDLVDDPNAKFVIADTTKDDLHDMIEQSFDKGETLQEMHDRIITAGTFADLRSQLIAKTEVGFAQVHGHLDAWKQDKTITKVEIRLSDDHVVYDFCDTLSANSPYDINEVPIIPIHPNCMCSVAVWEGE